MEPTIGRIVLYTLTEQDAAQINRRRTTGTSIAERIKLQEGTDRLRWPMGAQAHIGATVKAGDVFPMIITRVLNSYTASGQIFLDGNDTLWVRAVERDWTREVPGTWTWPERDES